MKRMNVADVFDIFAVCDLWRKLGCAVEYILAEFIVMILTDVHCKKSLRYQSTNFIILV